MSLLLCFKEILNAEAVTLDFYHQVVVVQFIVYLLVWRLVGTPDELFFFHVSLASRRFVLITLLQCSALKSGYFLTLKVVKRTCIDTSSMEGLSEPLHADIIKRIIRTSDLNSFSLVSKQLYIVNAEEMATIHVGIGLHPATEALAALCSRFPNQKLSYTCVINICGLICI
jgi:hypothetical protein